MELHCNFKNIAGELLILIKTVCLIYIITLRKAHIGTYSLDQSLD